MPFQKITPALIAICAFNALSGLPTFAADLTIVSTPITPHTVPAPKQQGRGESVKRQHSFGVPSGTKQESRKKNPAKKGASARRQGKITHNLFDGTRFKLRDVANSSNPPFGILYRDKRLGSGLSDTGSMASISAQPKTLLNSSDGTGQKTEAANGAGITSDCRGKTAPIIGVHRELTACYTHNHDKGWKTQTYLSKGFADRSSGWGGGLAVGFAY